MKLRAITSTVLLILFLITTITGIGLFFSPSGKLARAYGWSFLGMTRDNLSLKHTIISFLFVAVAVFHFAVNYKMYECEIKSLFKKK